MKWALCGGPEPRLSWACCGSGTRVFPTHSGAGSGHMQGRGPWGLWPPGAGGTCGWTLGLWTRRGLDSRGTGARGRRRRGSPAVRQRAMAAGGTGWPFPDLDHKDTWPHSLLSGMYKNLGVNWEKEKPMEKGTDTGSRHAAKGTVNAVPGARRNAEGPRRVHGRPARGSGRGAPGQGLGPGSCCGLWGQGDLASPLKPDLAPWHPQTTSVPGCDRTSRPQDPFSLLRILEPRAL